MFADPCRDFPLTPRAGSPDSLQIIATDCNGNGTTLFQTDLAPFVGVWVEAFEQITYSHTGKYSVVFNLVPGQGADLPKRRQRREHTGQD